MTQNFGLTYHLGVLISLGIPAFYAVKSVILRVCEGKVEVLLLRYVNTQQTNKNTKNIRCFYSQRLQYKFAQVSNTTTAIEKILFCCSNILKKIVLLHKYPKKGIRDV